MASAGQHRVVRAIPGTHELGVATALRYVSPGARTLDLGAGSGALAERLQAAGLQVTGVDISNDFSLDVQFIRADLTDPAFAQGIKRGPALTGDSNVYVLKNVSRPDGMAKRRESGWRAS